MVKIGYMPRSSRSPDAPYSPFLPDFNWYERHEAVIAGSSPATIIDAVNNAKDDVDWLTDLFMQIRLFPAKLKRLFGFGKAAPDQTFSGLSDFLLLGRNDHELNLGLIGRFWQPLIDPVRMRSADEFMEFADPEIPKLLLRFTVIEIDGGHRVLRTETLVDVRGIKANVKFALYWMVIRVPSGLIRRRLLERVRRRLLLGAVQ